MKAIKSFAILLFIFCSCQKDPKIEPVIKATQISPESGREGERVTITGENFGSDKSILTVVFGNDKVALIESVTPTEIKVIAPAGATSGPLTINHNQQVVQTNVFTFYSIYTYGAVRTGDNYNATYWKDEKPTALTTNYSEITEMIVSSNDIHAIGYEYPSGLLNDRYPFYKKNGEAISITGTDVFTTFTGITVSESDVYICGIQRKNGSSGIAKYWKNGEEVILDISKYAMANDIQIYGSDIYVTGSIYPNAVYWRNGLLTVLGNNTSVTTASAISVVGSDVYVCGTLSVSGASVAQIWKNGISTILSIPDNDFSKLEYEAAYCLAVSNSDVYVGGGLYVTDGFGEVGSQPKFWKNGTAVSLSALGQTKLYVRGISVLQGDIFTIVSADVFNATSYMYRNSDAIISSPGSGMRLTGHQIVTY